MLELNKIYCGDCLELMKEIPDKSIDLVLTDPPYLINYFTNYRGNKTHDFCTPIEGDSDPQLIIDCAKEFKRVLKDNTAAYIFCNQDKIDFFKQTFEQQLNLKNIIIWVKNNWTAGDLLAQYGKQYEMILYLNKGRAIINGERYPDVWFFNRVCGDEQLHQNQKPVGLLERMILSHSNKGDIILDPFLGSGTTAVACKRLNRNFIGIEKEPKYVEIALKRLEKVNNHKIDEWF
jgi:site-specific DNA-methyltransferase (adenine-specific)